jgi:hypothetical protein
VDDYVARIAGLVSNQSRNDVLDAHETVDLSFALAANGAPSEFRVERAARPAAGAEVLRAATAAAPFPRPPFDPEACLWSGRVTIQMIGHLRCNDRLTDEFTEAVSARIQGAVERAGELTLEGDKIALRIRIDRSGAPAITVHDAKSAAVGERVAAIARGLAPFDAPGDAIAQCVADHPFFVWIELPAVTRGPVRVE